MAYTFNERIVVLMPTNGSGGGNNGLTFPIDQNGDKWAIGFTPHRAMNLVSVRFRIHSVTSTPVAYNVRVETDNGSGRPSGTLVNANATATISAGASAGWTAVLTFAAAVSLSVNTKYHIVVQPATDPASTNFITMWENAQFYPAACGNVLSWLPQRNTGAWSTGNGAVFLLEFDDGGTTKRWGQVYNGAGVYSPTNTLWIGERFVAPSTFWCWGCTVGHLNSTSAGTVGARLIDNSNTILRSSDLPAQMFDTASFRGPEFIWHWDPILLTKGSIYRCVWKDSSAAWRIDNFTCDDTAGIKEYQPRYEEFQKTQGTSSNGTASPTSWTDLTYEGCHNFTLFGSETSEGGGGLMRPTALAGGLV